MKLRALPSICTIALLTSSCGPPLGDYTVENVRLVRELPAPFRSEIGPGYTEFLELQLASATSLTALRDKLDAVYVHSEFCPFDDDHGVIVLGPVSEDGRDLVAPSRVPDLRADSGGRFHYRLFLVVGHRARPSRVPDQTLPTYDLRKDNRDICLRLSSPGYYLRPSRSGPIRIRANLIADALRNAAAPT